MIGEYHRNTLPTCFVSFAIQVHSNCSLWDSIVHKSNEKMQDFNSIIDNNNKTIPLLLVGASYVVFVVVG